MPCVCGAVLTHTTQGREGALLLQRCGQMWTKERGQGELATPFFTISIIRAALGWTEYGVWGWMSLSEDRWCRQADQVFIKSDGGGGVGPHE